MNALRVLSFVVALAAAAVGQDGSWDVPRDDEETSPVPISEPVVPAPVQGAPVDDVPSTPEPEGPTPEELAVEAARDALGLLRAAAERSAQRVADDVEANAAEKAEAAERGRRTLATWDAVEPLVLEGAPVAAMLDAAEVTVGDPATLTITVPFDGAGADATIAELDGPAVRLVPDPEWRGGRLGPVTSTLLADAWRLETTVQLVREGDAGLDGLALGLVVPGSLVAQASGDLPLGALVLALDTPAEVVLDLPATTIRRVDAERLPALPLPVPAVSYTAMLVVIVTGLALIGWAAWALMPREVVEVVAVVPPERTAIEALGSLRARLPQTTDAIPPFVDDVSAVLRGYVEAKFGVAAPDLTTDEFLARAAEHHPALAERREVLQPFLTQCDLVKFANHRPSLDAPPALLSTAEAFVEETRVVDDEVEVEADVESHGVAA